MPDYLTHAFLAEDAYKNLKQDTDKFDFNHFIIGAQGPDPLFHYNFVPWKSSGNASKVAGKIHRTKTKEFLSTLLKKTKTASKEMKGFALGFLCHYALDTSAHPYIFHKTGNYSKKTKQFRGNHLRLEKGIDNFYVKQRGNNPRFYKAQDHFPLLELTPDFTHIFNEVMLEVYNLKNIGELFANSYQDFRKSIHVLSYDPFGFKKMVYSLADLVTDSPTGYKSLSSRSNTHKFDIMNKNKTTWKHPVTGVESNLTFQELYEIALVKATNLVQLSLEYFSDKSERIFDAIKNVSYDSNLDCDEKQKMIHFNSIFN